MTLPCFQEYGHRLSHSSRDCRWWLTTRHLTRAAWKPSSAVTKWIIPTMISTVPAARPNAGYPTCPIIGCPQLPLTADMRYNIITMPLPMPKHAPVSHYRFYNRHASCARPGVTSPFNLLQKSHPLHLMENIKERAKTAIKWRKIRDVALWNVNTSASFYGWIYGFLWVAANF